MILERITVRRTDHGWEHIKFEKIKEGDVIQLYESDGRFVAAARAKEAAREDNKGVWGFPMEPMPLVELPMNFVLNKGLWEDVEKN